MLGERPGDPIVPRANIIYVALESGESVDDILAETTLGWHVFVQAKRKLSLSSLEISDLASVVGQILRQINSPIEPEKRPWSRLLDDDGDRILLVPSTLKSRKSDSMIRTPRFIHGCRAKRLRYAPANSPYTP